MIAKRPSSRRALVIIAVLVIVGSALYIATALLFQAQADVTSAARAADIAQSRALAWSGLQAVMSHLNDQRQKIISGELPTIDAQMVIYETPTRNGVVRLLPFGPAGEHLVSEAGKLDLNAVDAIALENTGMLDAAAAAAIIAFRSQQPGGRFQSVDDLLRTPGAAISAEALHGPIGEISTQDDQMLRDRDVAQRTEARLQEPRVRGLADVLTVFAIEPALQLNGSLRINLNVSWSDVLAKRIQDRFGPDAVALTKRIFDSGVKFSNEASLFQVLRQYQSPPENWPQIIDAFTTDDAEYQQGRLDINRAPYESLRGLPGVTPEQAAQIVRVRNELSSDEKTTIAWPAIAHVLPPEAYDALAGHVTTRTWTYLVRLAAGEVRADQPDMPLENRVVYEAVIDLSAPRTRVAYLRDITTLQSAARMAAASASAADSNSAADARISDQVNSVDSESEETAQAAGDGIGENDPNANGQSASAPSTSTNVVDSSVPDRSGVTTATATPGGGAATRADTSPRIGRWHRGD